MTSFLNEVAAELVSRGIVEPTGEQIAGAMAARINRQGELYERIFGTGYRSARVNGTREFVSALAESVYSKLRSEAIPEKVKLVCNECGKKRLVSAEGNYNDRCPKCGGVDWDVIG